MPLTFLIIVDFVLREDCSDEEEALLNWRQTLVGYESAYWDPPAWEIERQQDYPENIAFRKDEILFVGINLVAGNVHDQDEWEERQDDDLDWIERQYYEYEGEARVMVIFAHAAPSNPQNEDFFDTLLDLIEWEYTNMHFVFVHRNSATETSGYRPRYDGIDNLDVITVMGSIWPPMEAQIDLSDPEGEIRVSALQTFISPTEEEEPAEGPP